MLFLILGHAAKGQLHAGAVGSETVGSETCGGDQLCSGNGQCWLGECRCSRGFSGVTCSEIVGCPNECMGHGTCSRAGLDGAQRACHCLSGWSGLACDSRRCPADCSGRGRCTAGVCVCTDGYAGASCSVGSCRPACIHGECGADFHCQCKPGWTGVACDTPLPCAASAPPDARDAPQPLTPQPLAPHEPAPCGEHGECLRGLCFCEPDWFGVACSKRLCRAVRAPADGGGAADFAVAEATEPPCNGHGICVEDDGCECDAGWLAPDCGSRRCPNDCSGWHGVLMPRPSALHAALMRMAILMRTRIRKQHARAAHAPVCGQATASRPMECARASRATAAPTAPPPRW